MDENQDLRNGVMERFGLVDGGVKKTPPPVSPKVQVHEDVEDEDESQEPNEPLQPKVTDDSLYEAKGDSPTVGEMLQGVIENSKIDTEQVALTPEDRKRINETCIDEDIIADLLG